MLLAIILLSLTLCGLVGICFTASESRIVAILLLIGVALVFTGAPFVIGPIVIFGCGAFIYFLYRTMAWVVNLAIGSPRIRVAGSTRGLGTYTSTVCRIPPININKGVKR